MRSSIKYQDLQVLVWTGCVLIRRIWKGLRPLNLLLLYLLKNATKNKVYVDLPLVPDVSSSSEKNALEVLETSSVLPSDACKELKIESLKEVMVSGSQNIATNPFSVPNSSEGAETSSNDITDLSLSYQENINNLWMK